MPVVSDLAQTVNVGSDHYKNLTKAFGCAKNGDNVIKKLSEIDIFQILFYWIFREMNYKIIMTSTMGLWY